MPANISCPSCHQALNVPEDQLGRWINCPLCRMGFVALTDAVSESITAEPARAWSSEVNAASLPTLEERPASDGVNVGLVAVGAALALACVVGLVVWLSAPGPQRRAADSGDRRKLSKAEEDALTLAVEERRREIAAEEREQSKREQEETAVKQGEAGKAWYDQFPEAGHIEDIMNLPKGQGKPLNCTPEEKKERIKPWRQLRDRMTRDEVRQLLGEPEQVRSNRLQTIWYYPNWGPYYAYVQFDRGGILSRWLEPGDDGAGVPGPMRSKEELAKDVEDAGAAAQEAQDVLLKIQQQPLRATAQEMASKKKAWRKLTREATQSAVRNLLGEPARAESSRASTVWLYPSRAIYYAYVQFDQKTGKVIKWSEPE